MRLLEDLVGRRERFDEDRELVGDRVGNRDQVRIRQPEKFGECAVAAEDSKHGAVRTMARHRAAAPWQLARPHAAFISPDDAPSEQRPIPGCDDFADELVAGDAAIGHVAAGEFEIGAADSGQTHAHDTLAAARGRIGIVGAILDLAVEFERSHRMKPNPRADRVPRARPLKQKSRRAGYPTAWTTR